LAAVLLVACGVLAACGGGGDEVAADAEVRMRDNTFEPEVIQIESGQTVRFLNAGNVPHNAIDSNGAFNSLTENGANQKSGESYFVTLTEPGTYDYFCSLHAIQDNEGEWQGMIGSIIVGKAAADTTSGATS